MVTTIQYALLAGASYFDTRTDINRFPVPKDWGIGGQRGQLRNNFINDCYLVES